MGAAGVLRSPRGRKAPASALRAGVPSRDRRSPATIDASVRHTPSPWWKKGTRIGHGARPESRLRRLLRCARRYGGARLALGARRPRPPWGGAQARLNHRDTLITRCAPLPPPAARHSGRGRFPQSHLPNSPAPRPHLRSGTCIEPWLAERACAECRAPVEAPPARPRPLRRLDGHNSTCLLLPPLGVRWDAATATHLARECQCVIVGCPNPAARSSARRPLPAPERCSNATLADCPWGTRREGRVLRPRRAQGRVPPRAAQAARRDPKLHLENQRLTQENEAPHLAAPCEDEDEFGLVDPRTVAARKVRARAAGPDGWGRRPRVAPSTSKGKAPHPACAARGLRLRAPPRPRPLLTASPSRAPPRIVGPL